MKKTYRNALRSKAMIRQAFLELLEEKEMDRITVVDIVQRADLSRNTFYAHYQDVNAVLEEFQQQMYDGLSGALDEAVAQKAPDGMQHLLQKMAEYVEENKRSFRVLMRAPCAQTDVLQHIKQMLVDRVMGAIDPRQVKDSKGLHIFLEVVTVGSLGLLYQYLRDEVELSTEEIFTEAYRIFCAGLSRYCVAGYALPYSAALDSAAASAL